MRRMPSMDGLTYDGSPMALDPTDALAATKAVGSGWFAGNPGDYDRTHAPDVPQRFGVLHATQAGTFQKPGVVWYQDGKDIHWQKYLARLPSEIGKRAVIDVPLQGLAQGPLNLDLRHGTASPGHALKAIALWSIGLRTWRAESEGSKAEKRLGKPLNRLGIVSVPARAGRCHR